MNLLHLRYFAKLAQTLHYTRAAEHLCIAQPSLSHAISQMEAELGVPLFEKVGKSIVLTHYGEQFLACAQQTLMTLDNGVDCPSACGTRRRTDSSGASLYPGRRLCSRACRTISEAVS